MKSFGWLRVIVFLGVTLGFCNSVFANEARVSATASSVAREEWDEFEIEPVDSPHPYVDNMDLWYEFFYQGATAIKVYFERVETEQCCDTVGVYDANRTAKAGYKGLQLGFWSAAVPGDRMFVRLTSDFSVPSFGFKITKMAVQY